MTRNTFFLNLNVESSVTSDTNINIQTVAGTDRSCCAYPCVKVRKKNKGFRTRINMVAERVATRLKKRARSTGKIFRLMGDENLDGFFLWKRRGNLEAPCGVGGVVRVLHKTRIGELNKIAFGELHKTGNGELNKTGANNLNKKWNWRDRQDQFWREHQEWPEDEVMEWDMCDSLTKTQKSSTDYVTITGASREEETILDNFWEIIEDPSPSVEKLRQDSLETRLGDELHQHNTVDKITEGRTSTRSASSCF